MADVQNHGKTITAPENIWMPLNFTSSGVLLSCGKHNCPSSCHQIVDHSKLRCQSPEKKQCSEGHKTSWRCSEGEPKSCRRCERVRKEAERKLQREAEEQVKREDDARKHQETVRRYDEKIQTLTDGLMRQRLEAERTAVIEQKKEDLANAENRAREASTPTVIDKTAATSPINPPPKSVTKSEPHPANSANSPAASKSTPQFKAPLQNVSPSKKEWQRQKDQLNATNPAIDEIMNMIGLEEVKSQVLRIKAKVDTSTRQQTDLRKERFGLVLLGNPGIGLYFLVSFQCLSNSNRKNHCSETLRKSSHIVEGSSRRPFH